MPVTPKTFSIAVILLGLLAMPGPVTASYAADSCLDKAEQRDAVASRRAVPLASAIRSVQANGRHAELVRAELCQQDGRLVYVLTLLGQSGKVTRATIDAGSGEALGRH